MKLYFMKFVPADWLKDTRILTLTERGAWADILCLLWESKTRGEKTMPLTDWAQFLGQDEGQSAHILAELKRKEIADVIICNSVVTVKNRRMSRDEKARFETRKRVEKYRNKINKAESNNVVTDIVRVRSKKLDVRGKMLDVRDKNIDARIKNLNPPTPLTAEFDREATGKQRGSNREAIESVGKEIVQIPEDLKANEPEILKWLIYKQERRENYKPSGLNALWGVLRRLPADQRAMAIESSMGAGYKGIFPAKGGNDGKNKSSPARTSFPTEPGKYDKVGI